MDVDACTAILRRVTIGAARCMAAVVGFALATVSAADARAQALPSRLVTRIRLPNESSWAVVDIRRHDADFEIVAGHVPDRGRSCGTGDPRILLDGRSRAELEAPWATALRQRSCSLPRPLAGARTGWAPFFVEYVWNVRGPDRGSFRGLVPVQLGDQLLAPACHARSRLVSRLFRLWNAIRADARRGVVTNRYPLVRDSHPSNRVGSSTR